MFRESTGKGFIVMKKDNPFPECERCKDLSDCPCPDTTADITGLALPPYNCPKPIDIMRATNKRYKRRRWDE